MDTVTQIEAQLIMRHYDGFTPKSGRIRGRRIWCSSAGGKFGVARSIAVIPRRVDTSKRGHLDGGRVG